MERLKKKNTSSIKDEDSSPFYNESFFDCKQRAESLREWEKIFLIEEVWGASILPDFNRE